MVSLMQQLTLKYNIPKYYTRIIKHIKIDSDTEQSINSYCTISSFVPNYYIINTLRSVNIMFINSFFTIVVFTQDTYIWRMFRYLVYENMLLIMTYLILSNDNSP